MLCEGNEGKYEKTHENTLIPPPQYTPNTSKYHTKYRLQNEEIQFYTCQGFLGGNLIQ
jgi:hypothetical protein